MPEPVKVTSANVRLDQATKDALDKAQAALAGRGIAVTQSQVVRFAIAAYATQLEHEHAR